jgi:protein tyrosine/serine phosphatase
VQADPLNGQPPDLSHLNLPALRQTRVLIPNLHLVTPMLLRGAQPSADALLLLKQAGVKTIVNLRNEDLMVKQEEAQAKVLGLQYVSIPLDVFNRASDAAVKKFLSVATNPDCQPVYVHCLHGEDRTGTMCAIYRMTQESWSFDRAYQEMLALGFKPLLGQLTQTVYDYANRAAKPTPPGQLVVEGIRDKIQGIARKKP